MIDLLHIIFIAFIALVVYSAVSQRRAI